MSLTKRLRIELLGSLRVWQGRALIPDVRWHTLKEKELLAILATEAGQPFTQAWLCDALWPNASFDKAKANLRGRVSKLKRALEPALTARGKSRYILSQRGTYCLADLPEVEVDLREFFEKSEQGTKAMEAQRWEQAAGLLNEVRSAYGSGFLPEFALHEWTLPWQERCREQFRQSLLLQAQCCQQLGENDQRLHLLQHAFDLHPAHEQTALQLIQCQMLLGMRQEALDTFESCRQALCALEVVPGAELINLHRHVRQARFVSPSPPHGALRQPLPPNLAEPPFVNRTRELLALEQYTRQAFTQGGFGVGILGEPGIGKTRLCREYLRQLEPEAPVVLHCHGNRFGASMSYGCVREALLQCIEHLPQAFLEKMLPKRILEELQEPSPRPAVTAQGKDWPLMKLGFVNANGEKTSQQLMTGLQNVIRAVPDRVGAMVWWVEELQWMDQPSFNILCQLDLRRLPILLICSGDFNATQRMHSLLDTQFPGRSAHMQLLPLQEDDVHQLLGALSSHSISTGQMQQLYRQSGGNPMFLSNLLVYLFMHGHLTLRQGRWEGPEILPHNVLPLPIQESVRRNLDLLELDEQRLMSMAAVLGHRFELSCLRDMAELPEKRLMNVLEKLLAFRYLEEEDAASLAFPNDLIQTVAYERLGALERRKLHAKAARILSERQDLDDFSMQLAVLHHYEQGREYLQAYGCAKRALELALVQFWREPAQLLLKEAEELLGRCSFRGKLKRLEVFRLRWYNARLLGMLGQRKEQWKILQETLESMVEVGHTELTVHIHLEMSWVCLAGRLKMALSHAFDALWGLHQRADTADYALALQMAGRAYHALGRYRAAHSCLDEAHQIIKRLADRLLAAQILDNLGIVQRALTRLGQARQCHERALAEFVDLGDEFGQGVCFNNLAIWCNIVGLAQEAWRWARRSYALHTKLGNQRGRALALQGMAYSLALRGKYRWAHRFLHRAQRWYEELNEQARLVHLHYIHGNIYLKEGEPAKALSTYELGISVARFIEADDFICLLTSWQSMALLRLGQVEKAVWKSQEAMAHLEQGLEPWPHLLHFHHAQCLEAAKRPAQEVQHHVRAAYGSLMQTASSIAEPDAREVFLEGGLLQEHVAIVQAYERL